MESVALAVKEFTHGRTGDGSLLNIYHKGAVGGAEKEGVSAIRLW